MTEEIHAYVSRLNQKEMERSLAFVPEYGAIFDRSASKAAWRTPFLRLRSPAHPSRARSRDAFPHSLGPIFHWVGEHARLSHRAN
jgi:hypothetical protein